MKQTRNAHGKAIPSLCPVKDGHQFVLYGDSCSGVPKAPAETTLSALNKVIGRLSRTPEFCIFAGDEIIGLTGDERSLLSQWQHWLDVEMRWIPANSVPLYNVPGNHTVYDRMSERVYQEVHKRLPRNGPSDQMGLSYSVRRGDLLLIFINTMSLEMGGEGHVETVWLEATLERNRDAKWCFVTGHHPAFPVNGYVGEYQRTIGTEHVERLWSLLVKHGVSAYICSHILAYDVQIHDGVLQITTGGAGTPHLMPSEHEFHHVLQACIDENGLRYQVLDVDGVSRTKLSWPLSLPPSQNWTTLDHPVGHPQFEKIDDASAPDLMAYRLRGRTATEAVAGQQTLCALSCGKDSHMPLWIGLTGKNKRLVVKLQPWRHRSPHTWLGPELGTDRPFDIQVALHGDMGPGGILWRSDDTASWQSLTGASPWGPDVLFSMLRTQGDFRGCSVDGAPFGGTDFMATGYAQLNRKQTDML
ncbi:MAG: metallophosphoesterase [Pseudomonadota bacterium]